MSLFATLDEAREFFDHDRYAVENGAVIEKIGERTAVCSMQLTEHHRNAAGAVMGGAIITLADFVFAVSTNNREHHTVSQQVSVSYLNAPKGDRLTAQSFCVKDGRTTCVYNIMVRDDAGLDVAQVVITGYKVKK